MSVFGRVYLYPIGIHTRRSEHAQLPPRRRRAAVYRWFGVGRDFPSLVRILLFTDYLFMAPRATRVVADARSPEFLLWPLVQLTHRIQQAPQPLTS